MRSKAVIPCQHLLEHVKRQHGRHGMCLRTQQRYAVASAHFVVNFQRRKCVFEELVTIIYGRVTSTNKVNEANLDIFARKQRPYNEIPPSKSTLMEHIKHDIHGCNRYASR